MSNLVATFRSLDDYGIDKEVGTVSWDGKMAVANPPNGLLSNVAKSVSDWNDPESAMLELPILYKSAYLRASLTDKSKISNFSEGWQGPNRGPQGGTYWVSKATGEHKYQQDDPGGSGGAAQQQPAGNKIAGASDDAVKSAAQKYAQIAKEKWGNQAHAKLTEMVQKFGADQTPEGQRKLAAAKATLAAVHPETETPSEAKTEQKTTDPEKQPAEQVVVKSKSKPDVAPNSGFLSHATIPDRHVRYENGKPTKIHDSPPGESETEDVIFDTSSRPGMVRDKEGKVLSFQVDKPDKGDQTNNAGMHFKVRGDDYIRMTQAVKKGYDNYLSTLGEQASSLLEDQGWDEEFDADNARVATEELRGHIERAKSEIEEWYASALESKFGERFEEYAGTLQVDIDDAFTDAKDYLDAMASSEDAETFQENADGFHDAIGNAMDHVDAESDKIHDQIDEEIDAQTEAEESERDETVDQLNETDFDEAKKKAGEYNRAASKNEVPYRIKYNIKDKEWYYEEFAESDKDLSMENNNDEKFAEIDITTDRPKDMHGHTKSVSSKPRIKKKGKKKHKTKKRVVGGTALHQAAKTLGAKGGLTGGPARARSLSANRRTQIAREGGEARQRAKD